VDTKVLRAPAAGVRGRAICPGYDIINQASREPRQHLFGDSSRNKATVFLEKLADVTRTTEGLATAHGYASPMPRFDPLLDEGEPFRGQVPGFGSVLAFDIVGCGPPI
jgi:hypothetical protein